MEDIEHCRTEELGGHVFFCDTCDDYRYSYHSCKNRNCPKCGHENAQDWLDKKKNLLLPVNYFIVTFTLHDNIRRLAASHQRLIYDLLFRTSAAALQKLACDPEYVGGQIGMVGVLQTWTRDLSVLHPHVHYIVPGGGLSKEENLWLPAKQNFLMPNKALSKIFRAKFRDALEKTDIFHQIPPETWKQNWVVHIEPVGTGEHALEYLAPYIFQVAISNKRILDLQNGMVTFQYKESKTRQWKTKTIPAEKFISSFLQHVLPSRFIKVRYYGFLHPRKCDLLLKAQQLLGFQNTQTEPVTTLEQTDEQPDSDELPEEKPNTIRCPQCGNLMQWINDLLPKRRSYPFRVRSP